MNSQCGIPPGTHITDPRARTRAVSFPPLRLVASSLLAGMVVLLPAAARADAVVQAWAQRYSAPAGSADYANQVVADSAGNVIVAGYTDDGISGGKDMLVIKYAGTGSPVWTNRYNGPANSDDYANAVAVDTVGNVYVAGHSLGSGSSYDYATIGYSSAGVPLWTNRYNGPANGSDVASVVAVDVSGNVYVTGYSSGTGSAADYTTIKYSSLGVSLWTNRYNGPGNSDDLAQALAVDVNGNVFVTGRSSGGSSSWDYATVAYATGGLPLWTNRYNGSEGYQDYAQAVAVDTNGNVVVTGYSVGSDEFSDYATIKYSNAGIPLWTNRYNGPGNRSDQAQSVAVAASGDVYVTGHSATSDTFPYNFDYATIKYSSDGAPLWTNRYNGSGNGDDYAKAVAVDAGGNVIVAGYSAGTNSLPYRFDYATIKYSSAGVAVWTNRYDGPGSSEDYVSAVAVTGSGNVFVTGYIVASGIGSDFATVGYSSGGLPLWTNRYDGVGNFQDKGVAVAVGNSGNVYVTGNSYKSGGINPDYVTIGYSSGGAPLWTNAYDGPGNRTDEVRALAVDTNDNVYVTGSSQDSGGYSDYATIGYSSFGIPLWTNRYNGPADRNDEARALAIGLGGTVFVTGHSTGNGSGLDYATIAYSSAGAALWTNRYDGSGNGNDQANAVAVGNGGAVYVTGYSFNSGGINPDYATVAYSSAGMPLWTNRYDGPGNGNDYANAVAVDANGNVYVTGYSLGSGTSYDYATIAYSSAGMPLWTNRYNGPGNSDDYANAVAVDAGGNVYVTGYAWVGPTPFLDYDYATIAYSSAGTPLWTNFYNGPGDSDDRAQAVAVDTGGNVYVTGYSTNDTSGYDYVTLAYSGAGVALWTNRYNGPANGDDQPQTKSSLAVGPGREVCVIGVSDGNYGNANTPDFATVKYLTPLAPIIVSPPADTTNVAGTTASFTVTASGSLPLSYQWRRQGTNLLDNGRLSGVTTTNLLIANVQTNDAGEYAVVVTNSQGSVTGSVARLVVVQAVPRETLQVQPLSGGRVRMVIQGGVGRVFTLLGSPDLFHWARLGARTNLTGTLVLTNTIPAERSAYFYRTVVFPPANPPAGPAPSLSGAAWLPDGRMRFQLNATPGSAWRVEGSPDLTHWGNYGVVTNSGGALAITNTPFGRPPGYFYRVAQP